MPATDAADEPRHRPDDEAHKRDDVQGGALRKAPPEQAREALEGYGEVDQ
jgi:hypothetical protein